MGDSAVNARREARRRRILENSENRLQKIFGNQETVTATSFVGVDEDTSRHTSFSQSNGNPSIDAWNDRSIKPTLIASSNSEHLHSGAITAEDDFFRTEDLLIGLNDLLGKAQSRQKEVTTQIPTEETSNSAQLVLHSLNARRLRTILVALLANLAFTFNYGFLFGELLLLPFALMELTETLLWNSKLEQAPGGSGILGLALILSGLPAHRVTLFNTLFNYASKIVQNFSIYFFTFVMFHSILNWGG